MHIPVHNTPHTEETKARMRETAKAVAKRPGVIRARKRGAKAVWDRHGKEEMGRRISDGIKRSQERRKAEKEAKNAAAVAAHLNLTRRAV